MPIIRLPLFIVLIATLTACSESIDSPTDMSSATPAEPITNRVDIPPAVRKNLGITFARVEKRRLGQTIRVPGSFELTPQARHEYRTTLPGRVEYLVEQYQPVETGTPLYRMQSPEWPEVQHEISEAIFGIAGARSNVTVAEAVLNENQTKIAVLQNRVDALSNVEVRRAELESQLAELKAVSPRFHAELEATQVMLAAAEEHLDHIMGRAAAFLAIPRADLEQETSIDGRKLPRWQTIDWIEVKAAQPGIVESIALTPGGWAETASLVLTTANPLLVRFRGLGLQADLPRLRHGAPAVIIAPQGIGSTLESIPADLTIGLEADPAARTIALLAIPRPGSLAEWTRPGVSAFLEVETAGTGTEEMVIPRSAIVQDGLAHIIFRRDPANPDKVIRMEADLGLSDGRWSVVNSGVRVGDEVVLNGVYELKLATSATAQRGGHFHADGTFHTEDE